MRIRNSRWVAAALYALLTLAPIAAHAADHVTAEVQVSATVAANCQLTVDPLVFGTYDPLGTHQTTALDGSAQLTVSCTRGTQATIVMDGGKNAGQDAPIRLLAQLGENLSYQLYQDSSRIHVWGRGSDAYAFVSTGGLPGQKLTVYARIPPGQEVPAGTYTDVVTASVDF